MAKLIFPFVLGFALVVAQPIVDLVCELVLEKNRYSNQAIEAAKWTGATAAFLPSAVLTAYGALLVMWDEGHEDGDWILIGTVIVLVVCFLLFLYVIARGGPAQSRQIRVHKFEYTWLQAVLAALNVGGIVLAVVYHRHGAAAVSLAPR